MLWMRNQLLAYQNAGVIDVEEEFHQRCFHITVYKNYGVKAQSNRPRKITSMPAATETGINAESDTIPDNR